MGQVDHLSLKSFSNSSSKSGMVLVFETDTFLVIGIFGEDSFWEESFEIETTFCIPFSFKAGGAFLGSTVLVVFDFWEIIGEEGGFVTGTSTIVSSTSDSRLTWIGTSLSWVLCVPPLEISLWNLLVLMV